jgi:hypothetical protein
MQRMSWRRSRTGLCHRGGNFKKEGVFHSEGSQKARIWQRPLKWKIPIALPASAQRLEWKPVFRGAMKGLKSEEKVRAAHIPKKWSEGMARERCSR